LSAALIGGGALGLDKRPVLAGLCFGALVYKPHLAVMVRVALTAARRSMTFAAGARESRAQSRRRRKDAERVRGGPPAAQPLTLAYAL
jgi:hypothetical protein